MAKKNKRKSHHGGGAVAVALFAGIGALAGIALLGRRSTGTGNERRETEASIDETRTARDDLAARAPDAFRPDPTAEVPADKRDALRPATLPNPMTAEPVI